MNRKRNIVVSIVCTLLVAGIWVYFLNANAVHSHRFMRMIHTDLPAESRVIVEQDEHGGFFGDGEYYAEIQLTPDGARGFLQAVDRTGGWRPLPLPDDVDRLIYGGFVMGGISRVPPISRGCYFVEDRYAEMYPDEKKTGILNRSSINITVALLDTDTSMLYIYQLDT